MFDSPRIVRARIQQQFTCATAPMGRWHLCSLMGAVLTGCALSVYKKPAQAYEQPERVGRQGMAP